MRQIQMLLTDRDDERITFRQQQWVMPSWTYVGGADEMPTLPEPPPDEPLVQFRTMFP